MEAAVIENKQNKSILGKYIYQKENLLNAFDSLISKEIVPCKFQEKEYNIKAVEEVREEFNNEEFTISVCGQINAGKSTLLNYLLFKDKEILPTDDTPWTAKLSTISYGEEDSAIVTFYSSDQWEGLKQSNYNEGKEEKNYYDEFLKDDVDRLSFEEGIQVDEYILSKAKVSNNVSLSKLREYVAKGGKYTPFVSHVDIKVNNEIAKGVKFVDTPGLNDNNTYRSKVTKDWISKSSAVIYLFYTGQPLGNADYDFIDRYLTSIPTEKIMFVLTKADTSDDYQGAIDYVENSLKNDEKLKSRKLLNNKKVYPISTLASIINYKTLKNISLSEDDEFQKERLYEDSYDFITNDGYIPDLIEGIQKHLMQDKGKYIIEKGKKVIEDICVTKSNSIILESKSLENKIDDLSSSEKELEEKISEIANISKKLGRVKDEYEEKRNDLVLDLRNTNDRFIKKNTSETISNSIKELEESDDDAENMIRLTGHIVKTNLEDGLSNLADDLKSSNVGNKLEGLQEDFDRDIKEVLGRKLTESLLVFFPPVISFIEELDNLNLQKLNYDYLNENSRASRWSWFSGDYKKSTLNNLKVEIKSYVNDHFKKTISGKLKGLLENKIDKFFKELTNGINSELNSMIENAKSIKENKTNKVLKLELTKTQLSEKINIGNKYKEKIDKITNLIK